VRFDSALASGRLLNQTSQREMFANRGKGYGYGWEVEDWAVRTDTPLPVVLHTGSIPGYQSIFVRSLSDHVAIVILDNAWQGATVVAMARDIADLVHGKPVALPRRSLQAALSPILFREGLDAMRAAYIRLRAGESTLYDVSEPALNAFGYSLLRKDQPKAAIEVFRWNAEAHPLSHNVHDSLAEALLASGDREGARTGYAKVLALDPGNRHATEELEKLRHIHP
jgi:D-alanyl-D-alanine carboxypeptidase